MYNLECEYHMQEVEVVLLLPAGTADVGGADLVGFTPDGGVFHFVTDSLPFPGAVTPDA